MEEDILEKRYEEAMKVLNETSLPLFVEDTFEDIFLAYKQNEKSLELADRILKLVISDMQLEGYFKGMKYESVIEYYKRREDL